MRFHLSVTDIIASPVRLKIAAFMLTHDAPMSEREIASILKVSHMSVNRVMADLGRIHFVASRTVGKAHVWAVNRKSYVYGLVKAVVGIVKAQPDPLSVLKDRILKYLSGPAVCRVALFGSVAKGEEREDSDIDLFIIVKKDKDKDAIELMVSKLSAECLDMFGNRVAPYILSEKEFNAKRSLAVVKEAEKGEILYEFKV